MPIFQPSLPLNLSSTDGALANVVIAEKNFLGLLSTPEK